MRGSRIELLRNLLPTLLAIGLLIFLCLVTSQVHAGVSRIWAVGDGTKIDRDDLHSPFADSNPVWNGEKIILRGARNEMIAFQIIVESDSHGIGELSLSFPGLLHSSGGSSILYNPPAPDPTQYRDRPIQLFSINYMNVSKPTNASWIYEKGPTAPKNPTGWKPVQIIPENAKSSKGGFPIKVNSRTNQAFWIELYTGKDRPSGIYSGQIKVQADGEERYLPVELELFNFNLPDRNSIHAMVYFESEQPLRYQGRRLDAEYHRFAHRHRLELVHAYSVQTAENFIGRFLGGDFTPEKDYEGPGEGVGNTLIPASFYWPGTGYDNRDTAWRQSDEWMTFLNRNLSSYITFLYMPDEPGWDQFPLIRKIADNIHSNPGPGSQLPIFVTREYTPALDGWIDIWCVGPWAFDIERARKERAKGHEYWTYNGGRPYNGAIVIDAPATEARAVIWACFKHDIDVYFYWHSVHWYHNHQMKPGVSRYQNVWENPITFDTGESWANGDGVLIYPGQEIIHPAEDRGVAGPIGTIQLANLRRGLQDHLYLTTARNLGLNQLVEDVLEQVVPRVFSDTSGALGFAENESIYEDARLRLGKAIAEARALRRRR